MSAALSRPGDVAETSRHDVREVSRRDVRNIHQLAARAVTFREVQPLPAYPEASPTRLARRLGRRLTPTEEAIYAVWRKVARAGRPALQLSVGELAHKVGRCERSVSRALTGLSPHCGPRCLRHRAGGRATCDPCPPECSRHVDLLRTITVFEDVAGGWQDDAGRCYSKRQVASLYVAGANARAPARPRRARSEAPISRAAARGQIVTPTSSPSPKGKGRQGGEGRTLPSRCGRPLRGREKVSAPSGPTIFSPPPAGGSQGSQPTAAGGPPGATGGRAGGLGNEGSRGETSPATSPGDALATTEDLRAALQGSFFALPAWRDVPPPTPPAAAEALERRLARLRELAAAATPDRGGGPAGPPPEPTGGEP